MNIELIFLSKDLLKFNRECNDSETSYMDVCMNQSIINKTREVKKRKCKLEVEGNDDKSILYILSLKYKCKI